jgi:hypothetical protein
MVARPRKLYRKKRVLTEEQKEANRQRLAKAREARKAKRGNAPPKGVHPSLLDIPDEHPFSIKNVREWIKYNKSLLPEVKRQVRMNQNGAIARQASIEGYIRHMETYIRGGVWIDLFYGADQQHRCTQVTLVPAGPIDGR